MIVYARAYDIHMSDIPIEFLFLQIRLTIRIYLLPTTLPCINTTNMTAIHLFVQKVMTL